MENEYHRVASEVEGGGMDGRKVFLLTLLRVVRERRILKTLDAILEGKKKVFFFLYVEAKRIKKFHVKFIRLNYWQFLGIRKIPSRNRMQIEKLLNVGICLLVGEEVIEMLLCCGVLWMFEGSWRSRDVIEFLSRQIYH